MSFGLFNRFHSSRPKLCPLLIQMIVLEKSSNRLQFNNPKNISLIIDTSHESGHSYKNHLSEDAQLMVETRARVLIHCMEKHVMNLQTNCVLFDSVHQIFIKQSLNQLTIINVQAETQFILYDYHLNWILELNESD